MFLKSLNMISSFVQIYYNYVFEYLSNKLVNYQIINNKILELENNITKYNNKIIYL